MNIALSLDDNYVMPCLVCITSIFENNKNNKCNIYLITAGLKKENVAKFTKLASLYNQRVLIKVISPDLYANLPFYERYTFATYNRFMIPYVVDESKILYLDADIIVRKNLNSLWSKNIKGFACAVVEDQRGDDVRNHNRLRIETPYFNGGVQLMNLDYWRANDISKRLIQYLKDYPERCPYVDQDASNACLGGKVLFLDYQYNVQEDLFLPKNKLLIHYTKWKNIELAKEDPAIVHFCTALKPWYKECCHPFKSEFVQYAKMYDFVGYRETRYHSVGFRMVYPFFYFFSGLLSKFK